MIPNPKRFTLPAFAIAACLLVMAGLTGYRFFRGSRDWGFFIGTSAIAGAIALKMFSSRRVRLDEARVLVGRPRQAVGAVALFTMVVTAVFGGITFYRRFFQ